jgi:hypothetical protein
MAFEQLVAEDKSRKGGHDSRYDHPSSDAAADAPNVPRA